jgi:hypothetical protein
MEAPWNENASSSAIDSKGDRHGKVLIDLTLALSSTKFKSLLLQMSSIARNTMISSPLEQEEDDEL